MPTRPFSSHRPGPAIVAAVGLAGLAFVVRSRLRRWTNMSMIERMVRAASESDDVVELADFRIRHRRDGVHVSLRAGLHGTMAPDAAAAVRDDLRQRISRAVPDVAVVRVVTGAPSWSNMPAERPNPPGR